MGRHLQMIYVAVLVLILWHQPDLHQLQPCFPQTCGCHEQFFFSAHEEDRFWEEGWDMRRSKALNRLSVH